MGIGVSGFKRITPIFHHSTTPILLRFDAVTLRFLARREMIAAESGLGF
jgi:hypothetical protein